MIINAGVIVLLLGLPLVVFLLYQANDSNVSPYNRELCGVVGIFLGIIFQALYVLFQLLYAQRMMQQLIAQR